MPAIQNSRNAADFNHFVSAVNRMHCLNCRAAGIWTLASVVALLAGCGGQAYEDALQKRAKQLGREAPFLALNDTPQPINETTATVRLPKVFTGAPFAAGSADPKNQKPVSPERYQPPFLPLPGFKLCFEIAVATKDGSATLPCYCYLAATPGDGPTIEKGIVAKLKEAFPDQEPAWETVSCEAPNDAAAVPCRKLHLQGEQRFDIVPLNGEIIERQLPGTFELWHIDGPGKHIFIGWRIPEKLEADIHLCDSGDKSLASLTAGSIVFGTVMAPPVALPPAPGQEKK